MNDNTDFLMHVRDNLWLSSAGVWFERVWVKKGENDMNGLPRGYDAWRLASPDDESDAVGTEDGQTCGRYHEPDEDAPRGYKPKPCPGVMQDWCNGIECDTCGEIAT